MTHLEGISAEELRDVLDEVEGKRATQRVMVGLNYKEGLSQRRLAEMYGRTEKTIYNWLCRLDRLADEPVEDVVYDAPRPGRPPKLTGEQRERLEDALNRPPTDLGYDRSAWTPALAREYITETFDTNYELRRVREFMTDAGLSYETVRTTNSGTASASTESDARSGKKQWTN